MLQAFRAHYLEHQECSSANEAHEEALEGGKQEVAREKPSQADMDFEKKRGQGTP